MKKFLAIYIGTEDARKSSDGTPGDSVEIMECLPLPGQ